MLLLKIIFCFHTSWNVQCRRWICCYSTDSGTDCQYLRVNDTGRIFRFDHGCRDDTGTDFHQFSNVRRNAGFAGIPGVLLCSIGCIIPSFCICLILAHFYYKYRSVGGVQIVLGAMRPAVVSLIASAGASILMLGLFQAELREVVVGELRVVELGIFVVALFLLRKYKVSAIAIILGSGVVGTVIYALLGAI